MTYKLTEFGITKDGMSIPRDPANRHYQQFLQDVIDGAEVIGEDVVEPNYAELRASEYPDMATQLDMQYWDTVNSTTVWQDTIDDIKTKYPKTITGGTTVADVPAWVQEEADAKLFAQQLSAYKAATTRLSQYVLAEGREEIKEWQVSEVKTDYVMYEGEAIAVDSYGTATGTGTTLTGYDETTKEPIYTTTEYTYETITFGDVTVPVGEVEYAVEVVVQAAIEPLEPTVERTVYSDDMDAEPTVEVIENPLITQDNAERAEAQAVVDATPQPVKEAV